MSKMSKSLSGQVNGNPFIFKCGIIKLPLKTASHKRKQQLTTVKSILALFLQVFFPHFPSLLPSPPASLSPSLFSMYPHIFCKLFWAGASGGAQCVLRHSTGNSKHSDWINYQPLSPGLSGACQSGRLTVD